MPFDPVTFEIRVRPTKDGFSLSCNGLLPNALWYKTVASAVSYARERGKRHETTIKVFNAAGELVRQKTFPASNPNW